MNKLLLTSLLLASISGLASAVDPDTCLTPIEEDASTPTQHCFNLTAAENTEGMTPWDPWMGSVCVSMSGSETLEVTYELSEWWKLWDAKVWVGTDIADMPETADGKADTSGFIGNSESLKGNTGSYTVSVPLSSAGACSKDGSYNLIVAPYSYIGEPCVPPTDHWQDFTDYPAWGQDVDNRKESKLATYLEIPISCYCNGPPDEDDKKEKSMNAPPKEVASGSGDPHFKTFKGAKFDYHGECDLVLIDNPTFADGKGLKLHIRTTRVNYYSYIERIALQIGDDVLEFANDVDNFLVNGKVAEQQRKHHKTTIGGFWIRRDPTSISVRIKDEGRKDHGAGTSAKIDFHVRKNGFPGVIVDGGNTNIFTGSLGLLGEWETGKKLARDGETEMNDEDATAFALEWQVHDTEPMLFETARFPQFPTQCTPPQKMMGHRLGKSHMMNEAEKVCAHWKGDKEDCIFDVIATRDVLVAQEGHISSV